MINSNYFDKGLRTSFMKGTMPKNTCLCNQQPSWWTPIICPFARPSPTPNR